MTKHHGVDRKDSPKDTTIGGVAPMGVQIQGRWGAAAIGCTGWHQRPREETTVLGEPRGPGTELRMSPDQTIQAVEAGGLKLTRLVEVPPYHYGAVFGRSAP